MCIKASTIWKSKNKKRVHQTIKILNSSVTKMLNGEIMCWYWLYSRYFVDPKILFAYSYNTLSIIIMYIRLNWNWLSYGLDPLKYFHRNALNIWKMCHIWYINGWIVHSITIWLCILLNIRNIVSQNLWRRDIILLAIS